MQRAAWTISLNNEKTSKKEKVLLCGSQVVPPQRGHYCGLSVSTKYNDEKKVQERETKKPGRNSPEGGPVEGSIVERLGNPLPPLTGGLGRKNARKFGRRRVQRAHGRPGFRMFVYDEKAQPCRHRIVEWSRV